MLNSSVNGTEPEQKSRLLFCGSRIGGVRSVYMNPTEFKGPVVVVLDEARVGVCLNSLDLLALQWHFFGSAENMLSDQHLGIYTQHLSGCETCKAKVLHLPGMDHLLDDELSQDQVTISFQKDANRHLMSIPLRERMMQTFYG